MPAIFLSIKYANTACAIENIAIAATSLGIGNVVWMEPIAAISKGTAIRNAIYIPDDFSPMLCIFLNTESK